MQSTNLPSKYLVPFAKNDGAKVELPVTTATAGRASQSLGFSPITGLPPEAGGLPPQLEDFNGAMNQPARIAWWSQLGGKFPFDNTFATDANIGGYPLGAELVSSDNTGTWLSLADNNVANPDTIGTGWAPARAYGAFALTGQTGGTVTPTPVQVMKRRITIAGALTSNLIVILPNWLYSWDITNSTSGAFSVTVKTAAGAGVVVPQNGAPTPVVGDGTNIAQPAQNIAAGTTATQAAQVSQTTGRLLRTLVYTNVSGTQLVSVNGATATATGAGTYTPSATMSFCIVETQGGGGGGGGTGNPSASTVSLGAPGSSGSSGASYFSAATIGAGQTVTVGAGGAGGVNANGTAGGASAFGSLQSSPGGTAGTFINSVAPPYLLGILTGTTLGTTGANLTRSNGTSGGPSIAMTATTVGSYGGQGGGTVYGSPTVFTGANQTGTAATSYGAGGSGIAILNGAGPAQGGNGAGGLVVVREYA